jgi:hypothetical protein
MATYFLLLRDAGAFPADISPAEIQAVIEKYMRWGNGLRERGLLVSSDKLRDGEGRMLRPGPNGPVVTDGPFTEAKEVLGGYFAVTASSYDEAEAIARTCPHLEYGGSIEIRVVDEMELERTA